MLKLKSWVSRTAFLNHFGKSMVTFVSNFAVFGGVEILSENLSQFLRSHGRAKVEAPTCGEGKQVDPGG